MTPRAPDDDDGSYLRWHLLDHMPEQYSLPGVLLGSRWTADAAYLKHTMTAASGYERLGGVVNYLFAEPIQQTYDAFMALGQELADAGRFPERRPSIATRLLALSTADASPQARVSAGVVPFRPHRGVVLILEEPTGDLASWHESHERNHRSAVLETPGVAGVWSYASTDAWTLQPSCVGSPLLTTVIYLDADPLATAAALRPGIEQRWSTGAVRPVYAGPLRTMIRWDAWPEPDHRLASDRP